MTQLREAVYRRKEVLINKLLQFGVFKKDEQHLYELTLSEIEVVYKNELKRKKSIGQPKA